MKEVKGLSPRRELKDSCDLLPLRFLPQYLVESQEGIERFILRKVILNYV